MEAERLEPLLILDPVGSRSSAERTSVRRVHGWLPDAAGAVAWSEALDRFPDASVYQTWWFGAACWGERQASHLRVEQGTEVIGLAHLRVMRVPGLRCGVAQLRWGPVCGRAIQPGYVERLTLTLQALKEEYVRRRGLVLRVIPPVFEGGPEAECVRPALATAGFRRCDDFTAYRTLRLSLDPSLAELRRALDGKWRNQLAAAERNQLAVESGGTNELFREFAGIYRQMLARKRFATQVEVAAFERLQALLPAASKLQVWLARQGGELLAGLVVSGLGDSGIYLLGATAEAGLKSKAAYLLQWQAIQWLKQRGCRWYDLGGIDPEGNPGVYHFKRGMGGTEVIQMGAYEAGPGGLKQLGVGLAERSLGVLRAWRRRSRERKPAGEVATSPRGNEGRGPAN